MKRILATSAAVLAICLLAATTLCAQSDEPSLGDIARHKSALKAKRVVTNDEIPPSPEANNVPAAASKVGTSAKPADPDGKSDAADKSQPAADSQHRVQELTAENANLHKITDSLQEKINATTNQELIGALNEALQHAQQQLSKNENEIDKLKSAAPAPGGNGAAAGNPAAANSAPAPHGPK